jgi:integrase
MDTVFKRDGVWLLKFKDDGGAWVQERTKAQSKTEARALLVEFERKAERQQHGLEPLTLNPEGWTLGDLMRWWLETYSVHLEAHEHDQFSVRSHILGSPIAAKRLEQVTPAAIEQLLQSKEGSFAPGTINHVRSYVVRAFNKARRAGKWLGANPAEEVEMRRVPEVVVNILAPEEVFPFFTALELDQRPPFATAILTGLRKGEICGLQKTDVDLTRRLLTVRRSYARPFPKNKRQRVVRIPEELVPFLTYALQAWPGVWLFPDADGTPRTKFWQPEDILRRALKRADIVTGYKHVCRRKGCGHREERPDSALRTCPRCSMKLWPTGQVRYIRFHDLRHTYGSVLLMFGANLVSVQRLLGHSDPRITERRYGHLLPDFMSAEVNRLRFGLDQLAPRLAPALPPASGEGEPSEAGPVTNSPTVAGASKPFGAPVVRNEGEEKEEAGALEFSRGDPASSDGGVYGTRNRWDAEAQAADGARLSSPKLCGSAVSESRVCPRQTA